MLCSLKIKEHVVRLGREPLSFLSKSGKKGGEDKESTQLSFVSWMRRLLEHITILDHMSWENALFYCLVWICVCWANIGRAGSWIQLNRKMYLDMKWRVTCRFLIGAIGYKLSLSHARLQALLILFPLSFKGVGICSWHSSVIRGIKLVSKDTFTYTSYFCIQI